jgi:hypothetical protein
VSDPTDGELNTQQVARRLRDGLRSTALGYENALRGLEQVLDVIPALAQQAHTRRATLSHLVTQGTIAGLTLPMPAHVSQRGPLMVKLRAAKEALDRLASV